MLGMREPAIYGKDSLDQINENLLSLGFRLSAELDFFQSNHEGALVERIQEAIAKKMDGILINPGAYGHTSIAIRDALSLAGLPFVEVHLSNIHARESFRRKSLLSDIAIGTVAGFGAQSYELGLRGLLAKLSQPVKGS